MNHKKFFGFGFQKTNPQSKLTQTFQNLSTWRNLPAYQLERRVDIFFSVYLKKLLEAELRVDLEEVIIPELPIKRDLVWPDHPTSKSVKVDYALFSGDREDELSRLFAKSLEEWRTKAGQA